MNCCAHALCAAAVPDRLECLQACGGLGDDDVASEVSKDGSLCSSEVRVEVSSLPQGAAGPLSGRLVTTGQTTCTPPFLYERFMEFMEKMGNNIAAQPSTSSCMPTSNPIVLMHCEPRGGGMYLSSVQIRTR